MSPVFWTQRMHFGPAPRMDHAMAYDAARERAVLFGGVNAGGTFADTWIWDGVYWTQVSDTGPQARRSHAMAYDSVRRQVVLFGGSAGGATRLEDTWVWDGAGWTQVAETGPPPRRAHAMAWDDARSLVVLFGGEARTENCRTPGNGMAGIGLSAKKTAHRLGPDTLSRTMRPPPASYCSGALLKARS